VVTRIRFAQVDDARSTTRDDVRAALARGEAPLRRCPSCGREARTRDERCPHCGASYFARPRRFSGRTRALLIAVCGLLAATALAVTVVLVTDAKRERDAREATQRRARIAAERARLRRVQAPHRGSARGLRPAAGASRAERLAARAALLDAVREHITRDARARVVAGELDGPISGTECGPLLRSRDAVPDDRTLSRTIGRYDCVAVKADVARGGTSVGRLGHPFVAALDFERFTFVWCRNTPPQGEAGRALAFVRLDRACLAAKGRALGTGYVDVPGA
jgi:predicted RNA-binding Zn-ribbon protein involved in translation (DUF1610 family)